MEQYRSANSIPLHDFDSFAHQHVTQITQKSARMLDKAFERCIIVRSFVRSFVRVTYAQNSKSVNNQQIGANVETRPALRERTNNGIHAGMRIAYPECNSQLEFAPQTRKRMAFAAIRGRQSHIV